MANGLLASMAITDAVEIEALKNELHDSNQTIRRLNQRVAELEQANAGNLMEKVALRKHLGTLWPGHPLINRDVTEKLQARAAQIISTKGATWDDVRDAAMALQKSDLQGGFLPPPGTVCVLPPLDDSSPWKPYNVPSEHPLMKQLGAKSFFDR